MTAQDAVGARRRTAQPCTDDLDAAQLATLEEVERRVLWLATNIVHHANRVRPNPSGVKVGGHQASSASVVSIMTALFFDFMRAGDRLSVKPHASPVLHAIHYLLGNLEARHLTTLRQYKGLQAYPSRTKDPDPVDFSTGSVGLGSVAPNFAALTERLVQAHFGVRDGAAPRYISLLGDAELDEGSVWEAVAEPALARLDNVIWIVDLNRQSLDRVVPGLRVRQLEEMFRANRWTVLEAKYGRHVEAVFAEPGGADLRARIDAMENDEYQFLLRAPLPRVREALGTPVLDSRSDDEVRALLGDLGGHDQVVLRRTLRQADACDGPAVIFAYTVKGWGLPIAGDPLNHSALLTPEDMDSVRTQLAVDARDEWPAFAPGTAAQELCNARRETLARAALPAPQPLDVPAEAGLRFPGVTSTQRAFGQVLLGLSRAAPEAARRVVTVSPDVATSTNLGGWINKVGVWDADEVHDRFRDLGPRLIQWEQRPRGQHVELGISETNLLMALGQLGLAAEMTGEPLLPIGTLYDPFVARALDALVYGLYGGGRFILVGTPSGVTLAPEGGAHQSVITPSIGIALPGITYWEPCFAQELEWILLHALRGLHGEGAQSAYVRLTTAPVDQSLLHIRDREALRRQVLSGAYLLRDSRADAGYAAGENAVDIWATGIMVPQAVTAAEELRNDGVHANVINCVSPDVVYRTWQAAARGSLDTLVQPAQPLCTGNRAVTVIDGHPSALAWIGSMLGTQVLPLGVTGFGESGTPADLYAAHRIDAASIVKACFAIME
ncbi:MAG TPA: 1-deoxy-D-xylulose-5-phosphate synthase N-terminal domain-containing protein [Candidatus Dormibacteraeota bacterium]|nr:1-deoxy-D-xylulose-5-phosphate synthase N-terminal domain-containing protein [Candidatus Dormibacteraeota bacterium]